MDAIKTDKFEAFFKQHSTWSEVLNELRQVLDDSGLEPDVKWGMPTYTLHGKNVVGLGAFRHHVALWFHQGSLLQDKLSVLHNAQEGKTQGMRHWRFQDLDQVEENKAAIAVYIAEAKDNAQQGKSVPAIKRRKKVEMPIELLEALTRDAVLRACYDELTPGRQREYCEFIGLAKRESTRYSRLEKCLPLIKKGVGLNDLYRKS